MIEGALYLNTRNYAVVRCISFIKLKNEEWYEFEGLVILGSNILNSAYKYGYRPGLIRRFANHNMGT